MGRPTIEVQVCCEYNHGIICAGDDCERCGWNPEVHRERVEKLRERKVQTVQKRKAGHRNGI